jgi:hypothetical protein
VRQACTPPGAHPKANMCTPINIPSAPIAIIHHQHLLHHHYFHSPQPPPPRPSVISTSAATPSSNTQVSNFQTTPCLRPTTYAAQPSSTPSCTHFIYIPQSYSAFLTHIHILSLLNCSTSSSHILNFTASIHKFSANSQLSLLHSPPDSKADQDRGIALRQPWHIGYCLHGVALGADGWGNTIGPLLAWHSCLARPRHSRA